mmetsp:Transcript_5016/g.16031  ORF Transcript_5016/g.16031 Transcript_5016/m.16031 type:complete len:120 (+) Transcript_5016:175-534(+)
MATPVLYIKRGCPFCMKVMLFFAEIGISDKFEIQYDTEENRAMLEEQLGKAPTFPALKRDDEFLTESEDMIKLYAEENGVDRESLVAFNFYISSILPGYIRMVKHIGHPEAGKVISGEN